MDTTQQSSLKKGSPERSSPRQNSVQKNIDEEIVVVHRDTFFEKGYFQGLFKDQKGIYQQVVNKRMEFHPRVLMEENVLYKQIIPYLVFHYRGRYFVMQRTDHGSETRLHNQYSLGIGGHIRKEDLQGNSIVDWAKREFHEEVSYSGDVECELLGILNDDSNAVGKVHVGFVYLLHGNSAHISIKSELKSGELKTVDECKPLYEQFETWSKIILDRLMHPR
jgi:predicted NUDIX family phosphoesterase